MTAKSGLGKQLEEEGFRGFTSGDWRGFYNPSEAESTPADWIRLQHGRIEQSGGMRGSRSRIDGSPADTEWFIKQYHHGGILAAEGDVHFETPRRFLAEALAAKRARERGIEAPPPVAVAYREHQGSRFEGVYVSRFVPADPLSRRLREGSGDRLIETAGQALARLHEAGLDHGDFQLDNLLVDTKNRLVVTDFDPVSFRVPSDWKRALRLNRFERSLSKYGFPGGLSRSLRRGYRRVSGGRAMFYRLIQKPGFAIKNGLSDARYWWSGRPVKSPDRDRFLVRAPNWLGDAVMSLPAIQVLAEAHPESRVDVACRTSVAPVYSASPAVDRIRELPDSKTLRFPGEVQTQQYSTLLVFPKSLRTGIQAWLSGIPRRVGFRTQGRGFTLTDRVPLKGRDRSLHHARLYMDLLASFVDPPETLPEPELEEPSDGCSLPPRWLDEGYLTVHPGSAYGPAKRWPTELLNECLRLYLERFSGGVVVVGVKRENELAREVLRGLPGERVKNRVGETRLEELMSVLSHSRGVVANDSGVMHLAAALGVPTVGIFGSTDPKLTAPIGPRTRVIYRGVSCSPCFERTCPLDEDRYRCLTGISPRHVVEQIRELQTTRGLAS